MRPPANGHVNTAASATDAVSRPSPLPDYPGLGSPRWRLTSRKAEVYIWSPGRGLFVTAVLGTLDAEAAAAIILAGNEVLRQHRTLLAFHEWDHVPSYETEARLSLTRWGIEIRGAVERVHLLTRSKIVQMGITVARIVLQDMLVLHQDQRSFHVALRVALFERSGHR